jgi:hypothetical protein
MDGAYNRIVEVAQQPGVAPVKADTRPNNMYCTYSSRWLPTSRRWKGPIYSVSDIVCAHSVSPLWKTMTRFRMLLR